MNFLKFKNKSGIYKITNITNNNFYIGSSVNIYDRFRTHASKLLKNKHHCKHLQNAYNKYGKEYFTYDLIEECSKEVIVQREQYYLDNLRPHYNKAKIANTNIGIPMSDECKIFHRKRMIKAPVYQYNLEGEFIREWECANDITTTLKYSPSSIHRNLIGNMRRVKDFIFKYEKFDKIEPYKFIRNVKPIQRIIHKKDKKNNILKTYITLEEAAQDLQVSKSLISSWIFFNSFKRRDFVIEYGDKL